MFDNLKALLNEDENNDSVVAGRVLLEMAGDSPEDDLLDSISISSDEEKKIEKLVDKIPDDGFGSNDEPISDKELATAMKDTQDPTIEELLFDEDF